MGQEKEIRLKEIITEYRKSNIQSEAEVRSKLLIPIIDLLGYPTEHRAEEFPVYGWEGRKEIPAKNADYLLFDDVDFANHRDRSKESIDWVQNHSLLIIEAKKPGEMPDVDGQSMYYVQWTKALSYIVCDGELIRGYSKQECKSDIEMFNCSIDNLTYLEKLDSMSYERMMRLKDFKCERSQELISVENIDTISEEKIIQVKPETLNYMAQSLKLDRNSISKRELIRRFLATTDNILDCELRYDVPPYIFDFPRGEYKTKIYLDNRIFPYFVGQVTYYYWDDYERFYFKNEFIEIVVIYCKDNIKIFSIGYSVLDFQVSERLKKLELIKKCFDAKSIILEMQDHGIKNIEIKDIDFESKNELDDQKIMLNFWMDEMKKLVEIQKAYDVVFKLEPLYGEEISGLYDAVDNVYDSLVGNENCTFHFPMEMKKDFPKKINEPCFLEEKEISLPKQKIHNVTFKTCASVLLPYNIRKCEKKDGLIYLPCCCLYEVDYNDN